jgi:hypothetical protein
MPALESQPNWEGRASVLVLIIAAMAWQFMGIKRLGNPNENHWVMLAGLGLSDLLALVAAFRHPRGWVFLLLPGGISLFVAFVVTFGAPF